MKKIGNREWKVNAVVCIAYILKNPGNLRVVGIICYQIMTATLLRRRNRGRWGKGGGLDYHGFRNVFFSCKDVLGLV